MFPGLCSGREPCLGDSNQALAVAAAAVAGRRRERRTLPAEDQHRSDYLHIRSHGPELPGNTGAVETLGWRWGVVADAGEAQ